MPKRDDELAMDAFRLILAECRRLPSNEDRRRMLAAIRLWHNCSILRVAEHPEELFPDLRRDANKKDIAELGLET